MRLCLKNVVSTTTEALAKFYISYPITNTGFYGTGHATRHLNLDVRIGGFEGQSPLVYPLTSYENRVIARQTIPVITTYVNQFNDNKPEHAIYGKTPLTAFTRFGASIELSYAAGLYGWYTTDQDSIYMSNSVSPSNTTNSAYITPGQLLSIGPVDSYMHFKFYKV
jgi:hypothetical protein